MKKRFFAVFVVFSIIISLVSCQKFKPRPESGLYYCEELNITIDFSAFNQDEETAEAVLHSKDSICLECTAFYDDIDGTLCIVDEYSYIYCFYFTWNEVDTIEVEDYWEEQVYTFVKIDSVEDINCSCDGIGI